MIDGISFGRGVGPGAAGEGQSQRTAAVVRWSGAWRMWGAGASEGAEGIP